MQITKPYQFVNSFWYDKIVTTKPKPQLIASKTKDVWKMVRLGLLVFLVVLGLIYADFRFSQIGIQIFWLNVQKFFSFQSVAQDFPSTNLWVLSFRFLWITIKAVLLGTTLGFGAAFITSYVAISKFSHKALAYPSKTAVAALRLLPLLVFIFYFKNAFPNEEIGLLLTLFWFSWLWVHKYLLEILTNANYKLYQQKIIEGHSRLWAFKTTVWPQIATKCLALYLYSFESNVRWSTLLASLGFIGIGTLISNAAALDRFEEMGVPVVVLMLFLLGLEVFILLVKKFLIKTNQTPRFFTNQMSVYQYQRGQRVAIILFVCVLIGFLVYTLVVFDWQANFNPIANLFFPRLFTPNWTILLPGNFFGTNLFVAFLDLLIYAYLVSFFGFVITFGVLFTATKAFFKHTYYLSIFFTAIIRAFPVVALLFLFGPLFASNNALVLVLTIGAYSTLFKQSVEVANQIDPLVLHKLQVQGWSRLLIFKNYVLPTVVAHLKILVGIEYESAFRNLVNYGVLGGSQIGSSLNQFERVKQFENLAVLVWIIYFLLILMNIANTGFAYYKKHQQTKLHQDNHWLKQTIGSKLKLTKRKWLRYQN